MTGIQRPINLSKLLEDNDHEDKEHEEKGSGRPDGHVKAARTKIKVPEGTFTDV